MEIQMLAADAPAAEFVRIADIVNRVYRVAEKGIWKDGQVRTDTDDMRRLAGRGELAVARVDGEVIGCVRLSWVGADTGEFGVLAVDGSKQGAGAGRTLVRYAEETFRGAGVPVMQIKVLTPRNGTASFPSKEKLLNWYEKLGYEATDIELIDDDLQQLAIKLAIPCQFIIYQKKLR